MTTDPTRQGGYPAPPVDLADLPKPPHGPAPGSDRIPPQGGPEHWHVTACVFSRLTEQQREQLFDAVADAAHEVDVRWGDDDGADVHVSGGPCRCLADPEPSTSPAVQAQGGTGDTSLHSGTPGRPTAILGRRWLDDDGRVWQPDGGDWWRLPDGTGHTTQTLAEDYGGREVLLVSQEVWERHERLAEAADDLINLTRSAGVGVGDIDDAQVRLSDALDAMVGDRPVEPAPERPTIGGPDHDGLTGRPFAEPAPSSVAADLTQPSPEPDGGTGWSRESIAAVIERLRGGLASAQVYADHVERLLADRDWLSGWVETLKSIKRADGEELLRQRTIADAMRRELAEVTADRDRYREWNQQARTTLAGLQPQLISALATVARLEEELVSVRSDNDRMRRELETARADAGAGWDAAGDMAAKEEAAARDRAEVVRLRGEQGTARRDAAADALEPIAALTRDTDGNELHPDVELPVGEFQRVLAEVRERLVATGTRQLPTPSSEERPFHG